MTGGNVPGLKGMIFNKAVTTKLESFRTTGEVVHPLWDRIVFRKVGRLELFPSISQPSRLSQIQKVLGGQIKLVVSGSAPISPDALDFLKIALGCEVAEGM